MNHVMLDLETLGQEPGNVILTISAVQFDIETGLIGKTFQGDININSSLNHGLTIDSSTIMWWMEQNEEARKRIVASQQISTDLNEVLINFANWLSKLPHATTRSLLNRNDIYVWGRGPRFDMGLLSYAYKKLGWKWMPWDFRKERCVRTYESLAPEIKVEVDKNREGILHDGIDDAKHQIKYVVQIHNQIKYLQNNS